MLASKASKESRRPARNLELVCSKMEQLGVPVSLDEAETAMAGTRLAARHFARVLCDKGYVSTMQEAFDLYLADEAKASVERDEPTLEEGIQRITESGGMAALAHPVRLPAARPWNLPAFSNTSLTSGFKA